MQVLENKYDNSIIYKIVCNDPSIKDVYVGSTINIGHRISKHKKRCHNPKCREYNYKVYKFIRANGGFNNWRIVILELFETDNEKDLRNREYYFSRKLNSTLNSFKSIETNTKRLLYKEQNRDKTKLYNKQYYEKNKKTI